jgi:large subunit ribosomal protein L21
MAKEKPKAKSKESRAESKAESRAKAKAKSDAKAEAKAEAKAKADKAAAKARSKAKPKAESKGEPKAERKAEPRFAVIQAQGLQLRVAPQEEHILPHLDQEPGAELKFERVLLISEGDNVHVGTPLVEGALVVVQVIGHEKGDKVKVGTYKRRKKYRRKIGYRDSLTRVKILDISMPEGEKRGKHGA